MANLFRNVPSLIPKIMPDERPGPLSRTLSPYIRKSIVYSFSDFLIAFFSYYFCSFNHILLSVQFSSVTQSRPTLCDPMDCSTPGLPVHYNSRDLPKLMSIESVMPSKYLILCHPLLLPPSIFPIIRVFSNESSEFFTSGGQSIGVSASASVLPINIQDLFPLGWTGWISLQSKGLSRVFSNTTVQKHQCFGAQLSSQSNSHIHM